MSTARFDRDRSNSIFIRTCAENQQTASPSTVIVVCVCVCVDGRREDSRINEINNEQYIRTKKREMRSIAPGYPPRISSSAHRRRFLNTYRYLIVYNNNNNVKNIYNDSRAFELFIIIIRFIIV